MKLPKMFPMCERSPGRESECVWEDGRESRFKRGRINLMTHHIERERIDERLIFEY